MSSNWKILEDYLVGRQKSNRIFLLILCSIVVVLLLTLPKHMCAIPTACVRDEVCLHAWQSGRLLFFGQRPMYVCILLSECNSINPFIVLIRNLYAHLFYAPLCGWLVTSWASSGSMFSFTSLSLSHRRRSRYRHQTVEVNDTWSKFWASF